MSQIQDNPKIAIVILNWNGFEDTSECISSLQMISCSNYKIVVVDNGSVNDDYQSLKHKFPEIDIIRSETNLGFSGGNNFGINHALNQNPEYVLLLNNDTIVSPNFIEPLLKLFNEDNKIGIAAPQINYYDEPKKIWTAGGKISKIRGSGFAYSDKLENDIIRTIKEVTFVSGCCMLIKKEVLEKVGLFDDNFFLYVEDADLCYRVVKAGYKIVVSPDSKIYHKISRSTSASLSLLPLYYVTRNRLYFAKKNFPNIYFFTLLYLIITMVFKSIGWLINRKPANISIIIKAFSHFFNGSMGKTDHEKFFLTT